MSFSSIDKPSKYFNTVLYTGNITAPRTITGVGFNPDLVWVKDRSNANWHFLSDTVRGSNKNLATNATDAEANPTTYGNGGIGTPTTDGFTIVSGTTNSGNVNTNGSLYTSWNWLAGGTGVSNTSGTISSTVSANTTSGFSIVSYTGNGTNGATFGHGLGVTPKMVIVKRRSTSGTGWFTYHVGLTNNQYYIYLNSTNAQATGGQTTWNINSSTVGMYTYTDYNGNGDTYIAYCFAEVKGYSKFGSYTGNGSTDGTFVYTGFKPAFVLFKRTDAIDDWIIEDNKRSTYNVIDARLFPSDSSAELSNGNGKVDYLSNGFKIRHTAANMNASGGTYIYMAFAENPFVSSKGLPTTAR
jgi:hypothetical protein